MLSRTTIHRELKVQQQPFVYLEVSRIDSQLKGVQLAESEQTGEKVVDPVNSQTDSTEDLLSMLPHRSRAGSQVAPVGEVRLGLRVDQEHSA